MSEQERIERADTLAAPSIDASSFDATPPRLADRYELLGLLGSGGMGAVYRVRDVELGEIVALFTDLRDRPGWPALRAVVAERVRPILEALGLA